MIEIGAQKSQSGPIAWPNTHVYASGSDSTPSLIPAPWNIEILLHKQAKWRTIMHTTVIQLVYIAN